MQPGRFPPNPSPRPPVVDSGDCLLQICNWWGQLHISFISAGVATAETFMLLSSTTFIGCCWPYWVGCCITIYLLKLFCPMKLLLECCFIENFYWMLLSYRAGEGLKKTSLYTHFVDEGGVVGRCE